MKIKNHDSSMVGRIKKKKLSYRSPEIRSYSMAEGRVRLTACQESRVIRVEHGECRSCWDQLVTEEPLEIRIRYLRKGCWVSVPVSVTMRTPGHDFELAAGFLFGEGIIRSSEDIHRVEYCQEVDAEAHNVVQVYLRPGMEFDPERLSRHVMTHSGCGICGKTAIDQIWQVCPHPIHSTMKIRSEVLTGLPDVLGHHQRVFQSTGGIHAAALFDAEGRLKILREDVGRHNTVDKLVGRLLLSRRIPQEGILLVSGRAGFELVQKAVLARIPVFAAVGAPSSLAVDLARQAGMTLIGFLRGDRFNIYSGEQRILV